MAAVSKPNIDEPKSNFLSPKSKTKGTSNASTITGREEPRSTGEGGSEEAPSEEKYRCLLIRQLHRQCERRPLPQCDHLWKVQIRGQRYLTLLTLHITGAE